MYSRNGKSSPLYFVPLIAILLISLELPGGSTLSLLPKRIYTIGEGVFTSSNEKEFKIDLKFHKLEKNFHTIDGIFIASASADADLEITPKLYHSTTATKIEDMKPSMIAIPKMNALKFMEHIYVPYIMPEIKTCSNLPVVQGKWGTRSTAGNYNIRGCKFNPSVFSILPVGHNAISAYFSRTKEPKYEANVTIYLDITTE